MRNRLLIIIILKFFLWSWLLIPTSLQASQPSLYVRKSATGNVEYYYRGHSGKKAIALLEQLIAYEENLQLLIFVHEEVDVGSLITLLKKLGQINWKNIVINDLVEGRLRKEKAIDELEEEAVD